MVGGCKSLRVLCCGDISDGCTAVCTSPGIRSSQFSDWEAAVMVSSGAVWAGAVCLIINICATGVAAAFAGSRVLCCFLYGHLLYRGHCIAKCFPHLSEPGLQDARGVLYLVLRFCPLHFSFLLVVAQADLPLPGHCLNDVYAPNGADNLVDAGRISYRVDGIPPCALVDDVFRFLQPGAGAPGSAPGDSGVCFQRRWLGWFWNGDAFSLQSLLV